MSFFFFFLMISGPIPCDLSMEPEKMRYDF